MSCRFSVKEILTATGGQLFLKGQDDVHGVGSDTRKSLEGQLFVALKGDNFDGHDFLDKAVEQGAKALLVHRKELVDKLSQAVTIILVVDTLKALQDLACFWRRKNNFLVLGVTGSNGKTTTKEFARTIIATKKSCHASQGSFNNHWGVPFSLLSASEETEVIVQEMGMNHAGEITELVKIAEPDVTVVTMVGQAHIGELGSQANVAKAKEEIYLAAPNSVQIFNRDNEWTDAMYERAKGRLHQDKVLTFSSFRPEVSVFLRATQLAGDYLEVSGRIDGLESTVKVPILGRQNVVNLMAASCLALASGLSAEDIWQALPLCRTVWGRNQIFKLPVGARVIFDAYNANPESMEALIKNQLELDVRGKRVAILGEMRELGQRASAAHEELGALVARAGVDLVWFIGPHKNEFKAGLEREGFKKIFFVSEGYEDSLAAKIGAMLNDQDLVVIKGSRAMRLEQVLTNWQISPYTKDNVS